jgi:hypothetical protein
MSGLIQIKMGKILVFIILLSLFFCPDIKINESTPAFQPIDFLLPFLLFYVFTRKKEFRWNNFYFLLLFFAIYIFFTMLINQQIGVVSSYFEIFKILKFALVILFFDLIEFKTRIDSWIKPIFILLAIINLLHFFNVFSINKFIEHYYSVGLNITYFGKDTLGQGAGKRMVGLMANPNTNAIIFSFFSLYFLPLKFNKNKMIWFFAAMTLSFMCQSRTILFAFFAIFLLIFIAKLAEWKLKEWLIIISVTLLAYFLAWMFSSSFFKYPIYGNSLFNGAALDSESAMGRIETWKFLGKMILEKPLFGFGPNKSFFYSNKIYSENEYVLYAWRYGIIGLLLYLSIFILLIKKCFNQFNSTFSKYLLLVIALFLTVALTNNPFTDRTLSLIFAIIIGIFFRNYKTDKLNN